MSDLPVIAFPVRHLTDARYFAAWNVDWIGYDLDLQRVDYVSPQQIEAIREWVEGPSTAIHCGRHQYDEISAFTELISADAIILEWPRDQVWPDIPDHLQLFVHFDKKPGVDFSWRDFPIATDRINLLLSADQHSVEHWLPDIPSLQKVFAGIYIYPSQDVPSLRQFLEKYTGIGLCLRGGDEEKTGYKSFDELDEILEGLEDMLW